MADFILDLNNEEMLLFSKQYINLAEMRTLLDKMKLEESSLSGVKYEEWKKKFNLLAETYNKKAGFDWYKLR